MNWEKVSKHLADEAERLRRDAPVAFPDDHQTQREMLTRASIFMTFAQAIRAGLVNV